MTTFNELQERIGAINGKNGFNDAENIPLELRHLYWSNKLFLVTTELAEALEELRNGHGITEEYTSGSEGKPEGAPSEIADAVIRLLGICFEAKINLEAVITDKLDFNESRPFKHGGKLF